MSVPTSAPVSAQVSAAEAARVCGLSEKTVRRWIRSGRLCADKREGAYSVALADVAALVGSMSAQVSVPLSVQVSAPGTDIPEEPVRPPEAQGADMADEDVRPSEEPFLTIIRELKMDLLQTTAAAAMWQERAGSLTDQLAAAESRILALMPPESAVASNLTAPPAAPTTAPLWSRFRACAPWLLLIVILLVAVVVLLGWVW